MRPIHPPNDTQPPTSMNAGSFFETSLDLRLITFHVIPWVIWWFVCCCCQVHCLYFLSCLKPSPASLFPLRSASAPKSFPLYLCLTLLLYWLHPHLITINWYGCGVLPENDFFLIDTFKIHYGCVLSPKKSIAFDVTCKTSDCWLYVSPKKLSIFSRIIIFWNHFHMNLDINSINDPLLLF